MAADPADGGTGGSAAIAAARAAESRPARARLYFLMFLACCMIFCCVILLLVWIRFNIPSLWNPPASSASVAWFTGTTVVVFAASLCGAIIFLVVFVKALSQRQRRRVRQVAWALVPIVSFTLLAWWPFLVLALVRLRARDWAVFAAYLAAVIAETGVAILSAQGIIPVGAQIITFVTVILLVAVTAAVHTLVAFRPAAGLPSLADAERTRAATRLQRPLIDASGTIPAEGFARL
jgi:hypothetical protein